MAEPETKRPEETENPPSYTPASFEKRTAAWVGVAYMVMLLFIITFSIFTGGRQLTGTFPLFLVPIAAGAAVIAVYRQRKGTAPGGLIGTMIALLVCAAGVVLGLLLGIPALMDAFHR